MSSSNVDEALSASLARNAVVSRHALSSSQRKQRARNVERAVADRVDARASSLRKMRNAMNATMYVREIQKLRREVRQLIEDAKIARAVQEFRRASSQAQARNASNRAASRELLQKLARATNAANAQAAKRAALYSAAANTGAAKAARAVMESFEE